MPPKKKAPLRSPSTGGNPWTDIDEQGTGLSVDDFITTLVVRTGNSLRRVVTLPYSDLFGLTMAEWRMLSVVAEAQCLPFSELVTRSETDKSLVSRAMPVAQRAQAAMIRVLSNEERQVLYRTLHKLRRACHDEEGPPDEG